MATNEQIVRRSFDKPISSSGWTITLDNNRVVVTGGIHDSAYAPVEFPVGLLEHFIADLRHGCRAPEAPEESDA